MRNTMEVAKIVIICTLCLVLATQGRIVESNAIQESSVDDSPSFMGQLVTILADANIITADDIQAYGRQARENPLSILAFDVFKELVSDVLTLTVGSYLGIETRRNSEEFNVMEMVMNAVRKNTLQKRMGCPT